MADGTAPQMPPGDKMVPDHPRWPHPLHPTFGFVDSSPVSAQGGGGFQAATTARTARRKSDDLDALPPHRARTSMLLGQLAGDDEFRARHQLPVRGRVGASSVTNKGFQQTLRFPTAG